ncbi:MAG: methionyl-tRNA formyltransferase [Patescibacteria group bacterium]
MKKIKIGFFGTPKLAGNLLEKLNEIFDISFIITQENKPTGRKKILTPPPVKLIAEKLGIKVFQPKNLRDESFFDEFIKFTSPQPSSKTEEEFLSIPHPNLGWNNKNVESVDAIIVIDYGKIIPQKILDLLPNKFLNVHFSLLPKYRGSCPVSFAILKGEKTSGISLFILEKTMDTGPIISERKIEILENDDRDLILEKSYNLAFEILQNDLPKFLRGEIVPKPQNHELATFCNFENDGQKSTILTNDDVRLNLSKSFEDLDRQIRAFRNWMDSWTIIDGKRVKIFKIQKAKKKNQNLFIENNELRTSENIDFNRLFAGHLKVFPNFENQFGEIIEISEFQIEGKNRVELKF